MNFVQQYGPWALIAGASEGVGRDFAETLAQKGLNVVLLARRQHVLDEVAAGIKQRNDVKTRTLAIDLSATDAAAQVVAGVSDLEIGFFVYCAGGERSNPICRKKAAMGYAFVLSTFPQYPRFDYE